MTLFTHFILVLWLTDVFCIPVSQDLPHELVNEKGIEREDTVNERKESTHNNVRIKKHDFRPNAFSEFFPSSPHRLFISPNQQNIPVQSFLLRDTFPLTDGSSLPLSSPVEVLQIPRSTFIRGRDEPIAGSLRTFNQPPNDAIFFQKNPLILTNRETLPFGFRLGTSPALASTGTPAISSRVSPALASSAPSPSQVIFQRIPVVIEIIDNNRFSTPVSIPHHNPFTSKSDHSKHGHLRFDPALASDKSLIPPNKVFNIEQSTVVSQFQDKDEGISHKFLVPPHQSSPDHLEQIVMKILNAPVSHKQFDQSKSTAAVPIQIPRITLQSTSDFSLSEAQKSPPQDSDQHDNGEMQKTDKALENVHVAIHASSAPQILSDNVMNAQKQSDAHVTHLENRKLISPERFPALLPQQFDDVIREEFRQPDLVTDSGQAPADLEHLNKELSSVQSGHRFSPPFHTMDKSTRTEITFFESSPLGLKEEAEADIISDDHNIFISQGKTTGLQTTDEVGTESPIILHTKSQRTSGEVNTAADSLADIMLALEHSGIEDLLDLDKILTENDERATDMTEQIIKDKSILPLMTTTQNDMPGFDSPLIDHDLIPNSSTDAIIVNPEIDFALLTSHEVQQQGNTNRGKSISQIDSSSVNKLMNRNTFPIPKVLDDDHIKGIRQNLRNDKLSGFADFHDHSFPEGQLFVPVASQLTVADAVDLVPLQQNSSTADVAPFTEQVLVHGDKKELTSESNLQIHAENKITGSHRKEERTRLTDDSHKEPDVGKEAFSSSATNHTLQSPADEAIELLSDLLNRYNEKDFDTHLDAILNLEELLEHIEPYLTFGMASPKISENFGMKIPPQKTDTATVGESEVLEILDLSDSGISKHSFEPSLTVESLEPKINDITKPIIHNTEEILPLHKKDAADNTSLFIPVEDGSFHNTPKSKDGAQQLMPNGISSTSINDDRLETVMHTDKDTSIFNFQLQSISKAAPNLMTDSQKSKSLSQESSVRLKNEHNTESSATNNDSAGAFLDETLTRSNDEKDDSSKIHIFMPDEMSLNVTVSDATKTQNETETLGIKIIPSESPEIISVNVQDGDSIRNMKFLIFQATTSEAQHVSQIPDVEPDVVVIKSITAAENLKIGDQSEASLSVTILSGDSNDGTSVPDSAREMTSDPNRKSQLLAQTESAIIVKSHPLGKFESTSEEKNFTESDSTVKKLEITTEKDSILIPIAENDEENVTGKSDSTERNSILASNFTLHDHSITAPDSVTSELDLSIQNGATNEHKPSDQLEPSAVSESIVLTELELNDSKTTPAGKGSLSISFHPTKALVALDSVISTDSDLLAASDKTKNEPTNLEATAENNAHFPGISEPIQQQVILDKFDMLVDQDSDILNREEPREDKSERTTEAEEGDAFEKTISHSEDSSSSAVSLHSTLKTKSDLSATSSRRREPESAKLRRGKENLLVRLIPTTEWEVISNVSFTVDEDAKIHSDSGNESSTTTESNPTSEDKVIMPETIIDSIISPESDPAIDKTIQLSSTLMNVHEKPLHKLNITIKQDSALLESSEPSEAKTMVHLNIAQDSNVDSIAGSDLQNTESISDIPTLKLSVRNKALITNKLESVVDDETSTGLGLNTQPDTRVFQKSELIADKILVESDLSEDQMEKPAVMEVTAKSLDSSMLESSDKTGTISDTEHKKQPLKSNILPSATGKVAAGTLSSAEITDIDTVTKSDSIKEDERAKMHPVVEIDVSLPNKLQPTEETEISSLLDLITELESGFIDISQLREDIEESKISEPTQDGNVHHIISDIHSNSTRSPTSDSKVKIKSDMSDTSANTQSESAKAEHVEDVTIQVTPMLVQINDNETSSSLNYTDSIEASAPDRAESETKIDSLAKSEQKSVFSDNIETLHNVDSRPDLESNLPAKFHQNEVTESSTKMELTPERKDTLSVKLQLAPEQEVLSQINSSIELSLSSHVETALDDKSHLHLTNKSDHLDLVLTDFNSTMGNESQLLFKADDQKRNNVSVNDTSVGSLHVTLADFEKGTLSLFLKFTKSLMDRDTTTDMPQLMTHKSIQIGNKEVVSRIQSVNAADKVSLTDKDSQDDGTSRKKAKSVTSDDTKHVEGTVGNDHIATVTLEFNDVVSTNFSDDTLIFSGPSATPDPFSEINITANAEGLSAESPSEFTVISRKMPDRTNDEIFVDVDVMPEDDTDDVTTITSSSIVEAQSVDFNASTQNDISTVAEISPDVVLDNDISSSNDIADPESSVKISDNALSTNITSSVTTSSSDNVDFNYDYGATTVAYDEDTTRNNDIVNEDDVTLDIIIGDNTDVPVPVALLNTEYYDTADAIDFLYFDAPVSETEPELKISVTESAFTQAENNTDDIFAEEPAIDNKTFNGNRFAADSIISLSTRLSGGVSAITDSSTAIPVTDNNQFFSSTADYDADDSSTTVHSLFDGELSIIEPTSFDILASVDTETHQDLTIAADLETELYTTTPSLYVSSESESQIIDNTSFNSFLAADKVAHNISSAENVEFADVPVIDVSADNTRIPPVSTDAIVLSTNDNHIRNLTVQNADTGFNVSSTDFNSDTSTVSQDTIHDNVAINIELNMGSVNQLTDDPILITVHDDFIFHPDDTTDPETNMTEKAFLEDEFTGNNDTSFSDQEIIDQPHGNEHEKASFLELTTIASDHPVIRIKTESSLLTDTLHENFPKAHSRPATFSKQPANITQFEEMDSPVFQKEVKHIEIDNLESHKKEHNSPHLNNSFAQEDSQNITVLAHESLARDALHSADILDNDFNKLKLSEKGTELGDARSTSDSIAGDKNLLTLQVSFTTQDKIPVADNESPQDIRTLTPDVPLETRKDSTPRTHHLKIKRPNRFPVIKQRTRTGDLSAQRHRTVKEDLLSESEIGTRTESVSRTVSSVISQKSDAPPPTVPEDNSLKITRGRKLQNRKSLAELASSVIAARKSRNRGIKPQKTGNESKNTRVEVTITTSHASVSVSDPVSNQRKKPLRTVKDKSRKSTAVSVTATPTQLSTIQNNQIISNSGRAVKNKTNKFIDRVISAVDTSDQRTKKIKSISIIERLLRDLKLAKKEQLNFDNSTLDEILTVENRKLSRASFIESLRSITETFMKQKSDNNSTAPKFVKGISAIMSNPNIVKEDSENKLLKVLVDSDHKPGTNSTTELGNVVLLDTARTFLSEQMGRLQSEALSHDSMSHDNKHQNPPVVSLRETTFSDTVNSTNTKAQNKINNAEIHFWKQLPSPVLNMTAERRTGKDALHETISSKTVSQHETLQAINEQEDHITPRSSNDQKPKRLLRPGTWIRGKSTVQNGDVKLAADQIEASLFAPRSDSDRNISPKLPHNPVELPSAQNNPSLPRLSTDETVILSTQGSHTQRLKSFNSRDPHHVHQRPAVITSRQSRINRPKYESFISSIN